MKKDLIILKPREVGMLAATRVALGAGLGLILSLKLTPEQRKNVGWGLLGIGIATTVPLLFGLIKRSRLSSDVPLESQRYFESFVE
jgi:hypothetical protein